MCGICASKHAPGEPHQVRNASNFNVQTGQSKLKKNFIPKKQSVSNRSASQSIQSKGIRENSIVVQPKFGRQARENNINRSQASVNLSNKKN